MFAELMPVIKDRPLTITVASVADGKIRVCVVPQSLKKDDAINDKVGHHKEVVKIPDATIQGLTTPLSLTGTPEELDRQLAETLTTYAASHERLQSGISRATQEIDEALKALEERNKAKTKPKPSKDEGKKEQDATKVDAPVATQTLPLDWVKPPAAPNAVSANDTGPANTTE
jgi:PRTRC genetic system protein E